MCHIKWKSEDPGEHTPPINPNKHAETPVEWPNAFTPGCDVNTTLVYVEGTITTNPGTGSFNVVTTTDSSSVAYLKVRSPSGKRGGTDKKN